MERNGFSISLFVRRNRADNSGKVPVFMKVSLAKASLSVNLNINVDPVMWNSKGSVEGCGKEPNSVNVFLDEAKARMRELYQQLLLEGKAFTLQQLKAEFTDNVPKEEQHTLIQ